MRATPSLPNQTGACSTTLPNAHVVAARIEALPVYPCQHQHHSNQTRMRMVASTHHESRGARSAENGHVWINLQLQISGGIKASCIHAYLAPSPLSRGSDTCHASNKRSNQPRAATESPRLARERWLIKRCHGDESCSQRGHGHQF